MKLKQGRKEEPTKTQNVRKQLINPPAKIFLLHKKQLNMTSYSKIIT